VGDRLAMAVGFIEDACFVRDPDLRVNKTPLQLLCVSPPLSLALF
jgi:hypothetical protein